MDPFVSVGLAEIEWARSCDVCATLADTLAATTDATPRRRPGERKGALTESR